MPGGVSAFDCLLAVDHLGHPRFPDSLNQLFPDSLRPEPKPKEEKPKTNATPLSAQSNASLTCPDMVLVCRRGAAVFVSPASLGSLGSLGSRRAMSSWLRCPATT